MWASEPKFSAMPTALDSQPLVARMLDSPLRSGWGLGLRSASRCDPVPFCRPLALDWVASLRVKEAIMSTYMPKPGEVKAEWHVIDATDQVLGRLASKVALLLQGKHKPTYTPHVDTGDFVILLNADKVKV